MAFAAFGPGIIICTRTDLANSTPINIGFAQELTLDVAGETKQLYGQNQYPLVAARGTIKATGKFKAAEISGIAWNNFFYGMTAFVQGGYQWNVSELHTLGPSAAGAANVTINLTGYDADLGAVYSTGAALAGLPSQKTTSAIPAAGFYRLNSGGTIYAFGDTAGTPVAITYTTTTTAGQSLLIVNQPIGTTPTFQLDYYTNLNQPTSTPFAVRIYSCIAAKHAMAFKITDFMTPEFDFDFFALQNGNVMDYVFPQIG
jgi:hypothetical protein